VKTSKLGKIVFGWPKSDFPIRAKCPECGCTLAIDAQKIRGSREQFARRENDVSVITMTKQSDGTFARTEHGGQEVRTSASATS
jgi:hypothetical protein